VTGVRAQKQEVIKQGSSIVHLIAGRYRRDQETRDRNGDEKSDKIWYPGEAGQAPGGVLLGGKPLCKQRHRRQQIKSTGVRKVTAIDSRKGTLSSDYRNDK